jgi:GNAT superfamily N-acetyltransferase
MCAERLPELPDHVRFETAYDGAAVAYPSGFAPLLSIVQPVEVRPFPLGVWQHFPNARKWYATTDEFYVLQGNPEAVLAAIRATDAGPHQIIDVIGPDPERDDPVYLAAGYSVDSVEILMDRPITSEDAATPDDPRVVGRLSDTQISALAEVWNNGRTANGYQPILLAHNAAPGLVQRFIEIEGEPAAYGRAMIVDGTALLCDVNAFPNFRRRGLGRAIMVALHAGLARAGASRVVLTSTTMGLPLYEQLGYRALAQDRIFTSNPR